MGGAFSSASTPSTLSLLQLNGLAQMVSSGASWFRVPGSYQTQARTTVYFPVGPSFRVLPMAFDLRVAHWGRDTSPLRARRWGALKGEGLTRAAEGVGRSRESHAGRGWRTRVEHRVVVGGVPKEEVQSGPTSLGVVRCPRAMSPQRKGVSGGTPSPMLRFWGWLPWDWVGAEVVFHLCARQGPGARGFNVPSPEPRFAAAGPLTYLQITGGRIISLGGVLILSYGALIKTFFLCKDIP